MRLRPGLASRLGVWERLPEKCPIGSGETLTGTDREVEELANWLLTDAKPLSGTATMARRREYPWLNEGQLRYRTARDSADPEALERLSLQPPYQPSLPPEALTCLPEPWPWPTEAP